MKYMVCYIMYINIKYNNFTPIKTSIGVETEIDLLKYHYVKIKCLRSNW